MISVSLKLLSGAMFKASDRTLGGQNVDVHNNTPFPETLKEYRQLVGR